MRIATPILLAVTISAAGCLTAYDSEPEATDGLAATAAEAVVTAGPCSRACAAVLNDDCDWQAQCAEGGWPAYAACGAAGEVRAIACGTAEQAAATGGLYGLTLCFAECAKPTPGNP